ncbi:MAG: hypothetical protein ACSLFF_03455 [Solirubrobacterales bacterium]
MSDPVSDWILELASNGISDGEFGGLGENGLVSIASESPDSPGESEDEVQFVVATKLGERVNAEMDRARGSHLLSFAELSA